jgi:PAS domain S-box-containing protein
MSRPLRVLILEDHLSDAELMVYELKSAGFSPEWTRVDDESAFLSELEKQPDIILADFNLPQYDASRALERLKEKGYNIPFIVVTGSISEEVAVAIMKQGAVDYLLKDRLTRLGQAVENALLQKKTLDSSLKAQADLKESEARFRRLAENAQDIIFRFRFFPERKYEYVSPAVIRILGYTPTDFYNNPEFDLQIIDQESLPQIFKATDNPERTKEPRLLKWATKTGKLVWLEERVVAITDENGKLVAMEGIARDVTEREHRERELKTLVNISSAMRTAQTQDELASVILDQVSTLTQATGVAFIIKDDQNLNNVIIQAKGELASSLGLRFPLGVGLIGKVIEEGQIYVTHDAERDCFIYKNLSLPKQRAAVFVPLKIHGEPIGAILVGMENLIEEEETSLLEAVSDLAANAIHRSRLTEETQHYAEMMKTVNKIGQALAETLDLQQIYQRLDLAIFELFPDTTSLFISRFDENKKIFNCVYGSVDSKIIGPNELPPAPLEPPGKGTQSEVIHTRKPLIIHNLQERIKNVRLNVTVGDSGPLVQSGLYVPMLAQGRIIGVVQVQSPTPNRYHDSDSEALSLIANTAAISIENGELFQQLQHSNIELFETYNSTLVGWADAMDLRDKETEGHTQRVVKITMELARRLGFTPEQLVDINRGALLHDIGKIGIPDRILLKPGPLSEEEWEIMRLHPQYAYQWLAPIKYLQNALEIPYCHHEHWDGSGYPRGLKGEEIPFSARIFAIVDVWDALRSDRPYRPAWTEDRILQYLRDQSGKLFDPLVVNAFMKILDEKTPLPSKAK